MDVENNPHSTSRVSLGFFFSTAEPSKWGLCTVDNTPGNSRTNLCFGHHMRSVFYFKVSSNMFKPHGTEDIGEARDVDRHNL